MGGEELEAEIVRDPDDPAPRLVYADWLIGRGDPRGDLISLQHRGLPADDWIAAHADHFYGPFAGMLRERAWRLGFLESCTVVLPAAQALSARGQMLQMLTGNPASTEPLAGFLAHPSARVLRRLVIKTADPCEAIAILARHDLSPLRHLAILAHDGPSPAALGPVGPLSHAAPDLRSLVLRDVSGDGFDLRDISFPSLRSLTLEAPGDITDSLERLYAARWPVLSHLRLRTCSPPGPAWTPLFAATPFPALRDFSFDTGTHTGFAYLVTESTLLSQLETLRYVTRDAEVDLRIFLARRHCFGHLRRLALPNPTTNEAAQLRSLCSDVRLG